MTSSARSLVTGAGGFLGANLVRRLLLHGQRVTALVRPGSSTWRLDDVAVGLDVLEAEVETLAHEQAAQLGSIDVVFHLAAAGVAPGAAGEAGVVRTNVEGTLRVLELALACGARRVVYAGSCFEYGGGERLAESTPLRPRSVYGATKTAGGLLGQLYTRQHGLEVSWLRPFTLYGPFEPAHRLVPSTMLAALAGEPVKLSGGEQRRDFVFVEDAVDAFLAAAEAPATDEPINVCTGVAVSVRELAALAAEAIGGAELDFGALPLRTDDTAELSGDPTRAREILGWRSSTSLEDGLRRTADWFREHADLYIRDKERAAT